MCSNLSYPKTGYNLPKENVLVLSCIDLRLTDDLQDFLNYDNLTNRYDLFTLAGTALMTQRLNPEMEGNFKPVPADEHDKLCIWKDIWDVHLNISLDLHKIRDVYIMEHENCGAYKAYLTENYRIKDEQQQHEEFSRALMDNIQKANPYLNVHSFYIDLRGNIKLLETRNKLEEYKASL